MFEVVHISTYINCAPEKAYEFAANPVNLSQWAAGLAQSEVKKEGDSWIAQAPFGKAKITFAPPNTFGVMDHDVELESGLKVHNPMRVLPNGKGSEFVFTLIRQQDMTDEEFAADKKAIETDLQTLKRILEK